MSERKRLAEMRARYYEGKTAELPSRGKILPPKKEEEFEEVSPEELPKEEPLEEVSPEELSKEEPLVEVSPEELLEWGEEGEGWEEEKKEVKRLPSRRALATRADIEKRMELLSEYVEESPEPELEALAELEELAERIRILDLVAFFDQEKERERRREDERRTLGVPTLSPDIQSRKELNAALSAFCGGEEGVTLGDDFSEMDMDALYRIRFFHGVCYDLETLWNILKAAHETKAVPTDPFSRKPFTPEERAAIATDYIRNVNPEATFVKGEPFDEKNVQLVIQPVGPYEGIPFYKLAVEITSPRRTLLVGYIPEYSSDVDLSANTFVLLANIQKLWERRRFLTRHHPAHEIDCCTVYIPRAPEVWLQGDLIGLFEKLYKDVSDKL